VETKLVDEKQVAAVKMKRALAALLLSAPALLLAAAAPALALTAHVERVAHFEDKRTMFGSTALVPQSNASSPVFLTTSWVYDPEEIVAYRGGSPLWRLDTSSAGRQMWIVTAGAFAATAPGKLNALAYWIEKDNGPLGNCSLSVFDSSRSPFAAGNGWRTVLLADVCAIVNLALSTSTYADISRDGSLVAAMAVSNGLNVSVHAFDGQTGKLRWTRSVSPPGPNHDYFTFSGLRVSADGEFVSFEFGDVSAVGGVKQYIVSGVDGKDRAVPVRGDGGLEPPISADGGYSVVTVGVASGGSRARVVRWNASSAAYEPAGEDIDGPKVAGVVWDLAEASSSFDPVSDRSFITLAWSSAGLNAAAVTMYDVSELTRPVAAYRTPVSTGDMDSSGVAIACFERLCIAGLFPGSGVSQPTVVLLDASSPTAVWNTTTAGSVLDVSIAPAEVPETYFVSASGCTTPGLCSGPGAEASLWTVSFSA
jgi:hypothetical protein